MRQLSLIAFVFLSISAFAQETPVKKEKKLKGTFYGAWGYNKDFFSRSDLHFSNDGSDHYDYTLYDVKAKDRPGFDQIFGGDLAIPQYVYRFGYYSTKNWGIEINFDHAKYVMVDNQVAHLTGTIHGQYYDQDTLVSPSFLKFEHTNGANFLMLNYLRRYEIWKSKGEKHHLFLAEKLGMGIVIPKTDVTMFGERLDNVFHIAGMIWAFDSGLRYEFFDHFFTEASLKGGFANYSDVLTVGTGKAHHHFFFGEVIWSFGFQFKLN